ncbi:hypothetical protein ACTQ5J_07035 [Fundicoccus sp. Sow4_F4]|uniref:hypothetical protein n=1 Tax=Fundicoccus sp. Sow4_F4 TaxID=3438783 RepID=UPI003F91FDC5
MKNLIFNAFGVNNDFVDTPNISEKTDNSKAIYLQNIFVSLKSAKITNPDDDVALVTNYSLPQDYEELFLENDIKIINITFDTYIMPASFPWALAFFKLCALKYVTELDEYENFLLLDADTITVRSLKDLWLESEYGIMLFNIDHNFSHKVRRSINEDYFRLYNESKNIQHYGGEFICGNKLHIKSFSDKCYSIYQRIIENNYDINKESGDEMIISIAAKNFPNLLDGGAYIDRYWTGKVYLVSTNYFYDPVAIWHLPGEKSTGIISVFKYLKKYGILPKNLPQILGLPKPKRSNFFMYVLKKLLLKNN